MNVYYIVFNKKTSEREKMIFDSCLDAFDYAERLNKQAGESLYSIAKAEM